MWGALAIGDIAGVIAGVMVGGVIDAGEPIDAMPGVAA